MCNQQSYSVFADHPHLSGNQQLTQKSKSNILVFSARPGIWNVTAPVSSDKHIKISELTPFIIKVENVTSARLDLNAGMCCQYYENTNTKQVRTKVYVLHIDWETAGGCSAVKMSLALSLSTISDSSSKHWLCNRHHTLT